MDIHRLTKPLLVLLGILHAVSANTDCGGKAFHCVNTTHFQICVDLGGGVSSTVDDFLIPCPAGTGCLITNNFECEFLPLTTPVELIQTSDVTNESEWLSGPTSTAVLDLKRSEVEQSEKITSNILGNAGVTTDITTTATTTEDSIILNLNASSNTLSTSDNSVKPNTLVPDVSKPVRKVISESNNASSIIANENFTQGYVPTTLSYIDDTVHFVSENLNPIIEDTSTSATTLPDIFIPSANVNNIFTTKAPNNVLADFQETLITETAISGTVTESNNIGTLSVMDDVYPTNKTTAPLLSNNVTTQVSEATPVNRTTFLNASLPETNTSKKLVEVESTTYISIFNYDSTLPPQAYAENVMMNSENIMIADGITHYPSVTSFKDDINLTTETSDTTISAVTKEDNFIKATVASIENFNQPPANVEITNFPILTPDYTTKVGRESYTTLNYESSTSLNEFNAQTDQFAPIQSVVNGDASKKTSIVVEKNEFTTPITTKMEVEPTHGAEGNIATTADVRDLNNFIPIDITSTAYPTQEIVTESSLNQVTEPNIEAQSLILPEVVEISKLKTQLISNEMTKKSLLPSETGLDVTTRGYVDENDKDSNTYASSGINQGENVMKETTPTLTSKSVNTDLTIGVNDNTEWSNIDSQIISSTIVPEINSKSTLENILLDNSAQYGNTATINLQLIDVTSPEYYLADTVTQAPKHIFADKGNNTHHVTEFGNVASMDATDSKLETQTIIYSTTTSPGPTYIANLQGSNQSMTQDTLIDNNNKNVDFQDLKNVTTESSLETASNTTTIIKMDATAKPEYNKTESVLYNNTEVIPKTNVADPEASNYPLDTGNPANVNYTESNNILQKSTGDQDPATIALLNNSQVIPEVKDNKSIQIQYDLTTVDPIIKINDPYVVNVILNKNEDPNSEKNDDHTITPITISSLQVEDISVQTPLQQNSSDRVVANTLNPLETIIINDASQHISTNEIVEQSTPTFNTTEINITVSTSSIISELIQNINSNKTDSAHINKEAPSAKKNKEFETTESYDPRKTVRKDIDNFPNIVVTTFKYNGQQDYNQKTVPDVTKGSTIESEDLNLNKNSQTHLTEQQISVPDLIDLKTQTEPTASIKDSQAKSIDTLTVGDIKKENESQKVSNISLINDVENNKKVNTMGLNDESKIIETDTFKNDNAKSQTDYSKLETNKPSAVYMEDNVSKITDVSEKHTIKKVEKLSDPLSTPAPDKITDSTLVSNLPVIFDEKSQTHIPEQQIVVPDLLSQQTKSEATASIKDLQAKSIDIFTVTDVKKENESQNVSNTSVINDVEKMNPIITADIKVNTMSSKIIETDTFKNDSAKSQTDYSNLETNKPSTIYMEENVSKIADVNEKNAIKKVEKLSDPKPTTAPYVTTGSTIVTIPPVIFDEKSQTHIPEQQTVVPDLISQQTKTEPNASIKDIQAKSIDTPTVTDIKKENESQNVSNTSVINDVKKIKPIITADIKVNTISSKIIETDTFKNDSAKSQTDYSNLETNKPSTIYMEENVSKIADVNEKNAIKKVEKLSDPKPTTAPYVTTGSTIVTIPPVIFDEKSQTHIPEQQTVVPDLISQQTKTEPNASIKDIQAKSIDTPTVTDIKKEKESQNVSNTSVINDVKKIKPIITADIKVNIMRPNDESKIKETDTNKNNNVKLQTDYTKLETNKSSIVYIEENVTKVTDVSEKHTIKKVAKLSDPKPTPAPDVTKVPNVHVITDEKSKTHIPQQQIVVPDFISQQTKTEPTANIKDLKAKSIDTFTVTDVKKENESQNVSNTPVTNDVEKMNPTITADIKFDTMSANEESKIKGTDTFKNDNLKSQTDYSKLENKLNITDVNEKHTTMKVENLSDPKPTTALDVTTGSPTIPKGVILNEKSQTHIPEQQIVVPDLIPQQTKTESTASLNDLQVKSFDTSVTDIKKENELQTLPSTALLDNVDRMNNTNIADIKGTVSSTEKLKTTDIRIKNMNVNPLTENSNVHTNESSKKISGQNISNISGIKENVTIKEISSSVNNKPNETLHSFDQSSKQPSVFDTSSKMNAKGSQSKDSKRVKQAGLITKKQAPVNPQIPRPSIDPKKSFDCKSYPRGRYADKKDCRKFYICIGTNQQAISGECPVNTVFSSITKQCTKNLSHCIRNNQFQCTSAGRFYDYLQGNVYYICVKNKLNAYVKFKFQCQNGFILDRKIVKCVTVINKKASNSPQTSSTDNDNNSKKDSESVAESKPERSTSVSKEKNEFSCDKEGTFADPNDCRRYFVCKKKHSEFRRKRRKCDSDELFNKEKKRCVDAESYECDL